MNNRTSSGTDRVIGVVHFIFVHLPHTYVFVAQSVIQTGFYFPDTALPAHFIALFGGRLPLYTHLLGIHDRSHTGMGSGKRHLLRHKTAAKLPPLGRAWI